MRLAQPSDPNPDAGAGSPVDCLDAWLRQAARHIRATLGLSHQEARLEASVLAAHALGVSRAWLVAHGRDVLSPAQRSRIDACLGRRLRGEPVAYITGQCEFYGLQLRITPAVLVPRPETETLVDAALEHLPADQACRVLDLGTGSGAVAIAIAAHRPLADILAIDQSPSALQLAQENARYHGLRNVRFQQSDWYHQVRRRNCDLIVANPPYLAANDPHLLEPGLRFEPISALVAGEDALAAIRVIVQGAPAHLRAGGWLFFEHGFAHAEDCRLLLATPSWQAVHTRVDLAGLPRVTGGQYCVHPPSCV